jgi:phage shock protein A
MEIEKKYEKLYESLKDANRRLQNEVMDLQIKLMKYEAEKRQWQAEKMVQNTVVQNALNNSNAMSNSYLEENRKLREEIKRLQGQS